MPIPIPIYERKEKINPGAPNVLMPTDTPEDIRAMQNLAATGMNVGERITASAQMMEEREKANLLEAELNKANDAQLEMILKVKNVLDQPGVNPYGVFQEGAFALEKYNEDALKNADPRITEKLSIALGKLKNSNLTHVATWQAEAQQKYDASVRSDIVTNSIKRGATFGDSPITVQETYDDMIDRLNNTFIGREIPEIVKNKATVSYASGVIQATIASGQVEYAKAYLEKWAGELKGAQVYDDLSRQMKSVFKDQNNTQAYSDLYEKFNGDLNKMSIYLENPENMKKHGLDLEGASYIKRRISEAITDRHVAEIDTVYNYYGAIEDKMNKAWEQGRAMTVDEIVYSPEYKKLEEAAAKGNKSAISQMSKIKNELNKKDRTTTDSIMIDMMDSQKLTTSTVAEIKEEGLKRGLKRADIEKLLAARQKYLKNPEEANYARFKTDAVKTMLTTAGIKSDEQQKLMGSAANFLYAEEKRLARNLTSDEAQATIIKGLQHVIVNEKKSFMGISIGTTKTEKHLMEVKNKAAILSKYDDTMPENKRPENIISNAFGSESQKALAVMKAESGGNPKAVNKNTNGTTDYGLFQINSIHIPELQQAGIIKNANDLLEVGANVTAAKYIYDKAGGTFNQDWNASRNKWDKTTKPDINTWLNAARKVNNGVSDDELIKYYKGKYK